MTDFRKSSRNADGRGHASTHRSASIPSQTTNATTGGADHANAPVATPFGAPAPVLARTVVCRTRFGPPSAHDGCRGGGGVWRVGRSREERRTCTVARWGGVDDRSGG